MKIATIILNAINLALWIVIIVRNERILRRLRRLK